MDLMSHDSIVAKARPYQKRPAVYFLILNHKVVYVGASRNVNRRIGEHVRNQTKPFDAYFAHYVDAKDVAAIEASYVQAFEPMYNSQQNKAYSASNQADAILASALSSST